MNPINWRRFGRNMLVFGAAFAVSIVLVWSVSGIFDNNTNPVAVPIFILCVAVIARFTDGYVYGIAASIISVLLVNYLFTFPYLVFDLRLSGYPLTFASMLLVSILISTLTTQIKKQEQLHYEVEKEKLRANLLRSVSHDIRTPLTSIIGASGLLQDDENLPVQTRRELVAQINHDAHWLVRLVENILSVTRFTGSEVALEKNDEVLEEIISSAVGKFHRTNPEMPVHVSQPDTILLVSANATLIEQVLLNLLDNVVTHGQTADQIWLTVENTASRVYVSVRDNGVGIAPERLEHLFDGQGSLPAIGRGDGKRNNLGIGLSACYGIIRAHGGEFSAENNPEGGARFQFWLPYEG